MKYLQIERLARIVSLKPSCAATLTASRAGYLSRLIFVLNAVKS